MIARAFVAALLALTAAACGEAPAPDPGKAESYAIKRAVEPAAGGGLQRVLLPPDILLAVRRGDLGDIRVFDADGRPLPTALIGSKGTPSERMVTVPAFPIVGSDEALASGLSITLQGNVARISGEPVATGTAPKIVAALLDTRAISEPVIAITLDAELPSQQPVTFTFEASGDLKNWDVLGERVLFRPNAGSALLGGERIGLPAVDLHQKFVRVRWRADAPLVNPISIKTASITSARAGVAQRIVVAAVSPPLDAPHELRFALPFPVGVAAVRVAGESIVPVALSGRTDREQPWTPIAATTLRKQAVDIDLGDARFNEYRLIADQRTTGFAHPPSFELLFEPVELLVQFESAPPYRLAAGLAGAPATFLDSSEIAPKLPADLAGLPTAKVVSATTVAPVSIAAPQAEGWLSSKRLMLWLILFAAVAVLGFVALRLMRQPSAG